MAKSELRIRAIFHFKEEPIKLHISICFMALAISKYIEPKAGVSIRRYLDEAKKAVDGQILNHITGKTVAIWAEPAEKMLGFANKLFQPH